MTVINLTLYSFRTCSLSEKRLYSINILYHHPDFSVSKIFDTEFDRFKNYSSFLLKISPTITSENHHFQINSYSSNIIYYARDGYF